MTGKKRSGPGRPRKPEAEHKEKISIWLSKKTTKWLRRTARRGLSQGKLIEMGLDLLRQVMAKKRKGGK